MYPNSLDGIISESEFRASMKNINRTNVSRSRLKCFVGTLAVGFIVGMKLFSVFGLGPRDLTYVCNLLIFGAAAICLGIIVRAFGCEKRSTNRLRETIAGESAKYANRSLRTCRWRLNSTTISSGLDDEEHPSVAYHVSRW